jgi:predicted ATP-grasp superfamily ATP-dependent carboligase
MNLLVTNAQEVQAYTIIRSLRGHADKVIITVGGTSVRVDDFPGMAFYSRFVDAHYQVPHFASDWAAGDLREQNTAAEEAYVARIEEICHREKIDTIIPSLDPEIYVFSKNKSRLERQGILTLVAEPEIVGSLIDKARTLKAANRVGFPTPRTHIPNTPADIEWIIDNTAPPWVMKPRVGAHVTGVSYISDPDELKRKYAEVVVRQPKPLVQEYISGLERCHYYITVDRNHEILSLLQPKPLYVYADGVTTSIKSAISDSDGPLIPELWALVRELGLWGGYTVQTKVDPRDGSPRLMEINPRFGHHLWYRTEIGVNEPLICLQVARGERVTANTVFPKGVALLDPYHDLFYFIRCLIRPQGRDIEQAPHRLLDLLRLHRRQYLNTRPKVFCPQFRAFFSDPRPCLRAYGFKINAHLCRPVVATVKRRLTGRQRQPAG